MMAEQSILKRYQVPLICAILAVLVIAAFEPLRHNNFVNYDDERYFLLNPHIQAGLTYDSVVWAFTSGYAAYWCPMTWLSIMADIECFGLSPLVTHIHNLVLHTASVLLLFLILRNITGSVWRSALVSVIFAIHPLRVESVAWAVERKDVLCAFFWMLTTAAYIGYARRGGLFRYMLVVLCLSLGLMSKPMMVSLPILFLILDFWPLRRIRGFSFRDNVLESIREYRSASIFQLLVEKIPLFILVALTCAVTYKVQEAGGAVDFLDVTRLDQFANIPVSYVRYLQKIFWPFNLAVLYPFPENGWPAWMPLSALLVLAGWTAFVVCCIKKYPFLLTGWLWFLATLLPVIGFVQNGGQAIADRYSYLPSAGILIMIIWGAERLFPGLRYRQVIFFVFGGILIAAMVAATRVQVSYWKDSITLYKHAVEVTDNNYNVCNNLGGCLMDQGKWNEALIYLQKSLEIRPDYYEANINMADLKKEFHQYNEALMYIDKALKKKPSEGTAYLIQGGIFRAMENYDAALQSFDKAMALSPNDFRAFYDAGVLLVKQGKTKEAIGYFKECIRCNPDWGSAYRDMGFAQQRLGLIEDALANYRVALKLIPNDYATCYQAGVCFQKIGNPRDAVYFYRQALNMKPDYLQAINKLAWLLATSPVQEIRNPSEAVSLARKANQLVGDNYWLMDTLAAACAAGQQFKEAVETINKAIALAKTKNDTMAIERFKIRLQFYEKNMPYMEQAAAEAQNKEPVMGK